MFHQFTDAWRIVHAHHRIVVDGVGNGHDGHGFIPPVKIGHLGLITKLIQRQSPKYNAVHVLGAK